MIKIPLFSIIIPVFNAREYLHQCVESVINQDFDNYEIILVDDGSTDGSLDVCRKQSELYSNVRFFSKKNEGQLSARLYGIEKSNGQYALFLDSDDYLKEGALSKISKYVAQTKSDCIVFGLSRVCNGKEIECWSENNGEIKIIESKKELYKKVLLDNKYNSMCRKAIKISIIKNKEYRDYYSFRHGEDLLQSLDIYKNTNNICFVPDIFYCYRVNENSVSFSQKYENYENPFDVKKIVYDFILKESVFDDDDLNEYKKFCLDKLIEEIVKIYNFRTSKKNRVNLYLSIQEHKLYRELLYNGYKCRLLSKKRRLVLFLFSKKIFNILFMFLPKK